VEYYFKLISTCHRKRDR